MTRRALCLLTLLLMIGNPSASAMDAREAPPAHGTLDITVDNETIALTAAAQWLTRHSSQQLSEMPITRHAGATPDDPVEWWVEVLPAQRAEAIYFFQGLHTEEHMESIGEPPAIGWQAVHIRFIWPPRHDRTVDDSTGYNMNKNY